MKVYILDDELNGIENLISIISDYADGLSIIGYNTDSHIAYNEILQLNPDLLFLDIRLSDETGFDFLKKFKNRSFEVIITTAYNEYALEAYHNYAIGYLQKPINIRMFLKIIEQAAVIIKHKKNKTNNSDQKILISNKTVKTLINVEDIIYLQAETNYTYFVLKNGNVLMASKHLKEYESKLPQNDFFRTHNEYIVNINYIKEYRAARCPELVMTNGAIISIANRRKSAFLSFYNR